MRLRLVDVAEAVGGRIVNGVGATDVVVDGASFDSRAVRPGQLFVALVAERDGHDYVDAALAAGAVAAMVERPPATGHAIVVDDTAAALMRLAAWARTRVSASVVGITGSVGKTSTKDLARAALGAGVRVTANERSFNNEQGLPVTILGAPDDCEALVVEMGMRGPGEIARLCSVAQPTIGVVTRVAAAHTERVGGIEGVARAKAELIEALPASGVAILNADDVRVRAMAERAAGDVVLFGAASDADVRIGAVTLDHLARASFAIDTPWGAAQVALAVSGEHMAVNAAAALAVAGSCGVDIAAAADALSGATLSPWRMEIVTLASGAVVINDAYNANPESMRAALATLAAMPVTGRKVAALGVMAELSEPAEDHRAIAALAAASGVELMAVGTDLYSVAPCDDPLSALASLAAGDALLVKASRVAGLDRLVAGLEQLSRAVDQV